MTLITIPLAIIASALFAYGIICILIDNSNNKGSEEMELDQFSRDSIELIAQENNLPLPIQIIDFPDQNQEKTNSK